MAELFEATWFFLPGTPPYAVCDDLQVLAAWAHHNVPRQGQRAPLDWLEGTWQSLD